MLFKYAFRDYKRLNLPCYLHLAIISFFFEAVFGIGTPLPIENLDQMVHFLGEKLFEHDLPKSFEYLTGVVGPRKLNSQVMESKYRPSKYEMIRAYNLLSFLVNRPSIEAHQNYNTLLLLLEQRKVTINTDLAIRLIRKVRSCTKTSFNRINKDDEMLASEASDPWLGPILVK